jgi:hypothetical protein
MGAIAWRRREAVVVRQRSWQSSLPMPPQPRHHARPTPNNRADDLGAIALVG